MCPDDPVLSSFHDHELPPGRSERIEAHLAGCEDCRTRLRRFQSVSHRLLECEEPDVEEAALRVWRRLDAHAPASARRRGSLRLPIAAASAALAVAFVFTLALGDRPPALGEWGRAALSRMAAVPDEPTEPYAGSERAVVMELALPSTSEFQLFGAPKILHEVELQPSSAASPGGPGMLAVSLPPARFQLVGSPVIVHEGELETAGP